MPPCQAAASVASASASLTLVKRSPSGAPPKPICGSITSERPSFLSLKGSIAGLSFGKMRGEVSAAPRRRSISRDGGKTGRELVDFALGDGIDRHGRAPHLRRTDDPLAHEELLVHVIENVAA